MSFSTFLIRSVGAATVAMSAYEINHKSKEHALYATREHTAKNLTDLFIHHNTHTNGHMHTEMMKDKYREWIMDDNYIPHAQYTKNRITGFGHGFIENIIPLGLGIGALMASSASRLRIYKGFVPKPLAAGCAIVAGLLAANSFYKNVLGKGHSHPPGFYP
jgi:hypothetical protein